MDTSRAVLTRRNVREFSDRPIDPGDLERILEAARWAPSSKNDQRWSFIVCTDRARLRELSHVGAYTDHVAGAAAAVACVVPEGREPWENEINSFDLGQAVENMMLVAWELGIGSCHGSVYEPGLARELLGYPEDHRCDLLVSLGYPADSSVFDAPRSQRARRSSSELVHLERW
jgi:nitroreductase